MNLGTVQSRKQFKALDELNALNGWNDLNEQRSELGGRDAFP
jgi:hypothetical protein